MSAKDLRGQRFGDLEVLEPAGRDTYGSIKWRCKCHRCGSECIKSAKHLNHNDPLMPKSCGCLSMDRRADLTGKTFGALTVLRRDGVFPNGPAAYICRCNLCGSEKRYAAANITRGQQSCGCLKASPDKMKAMSRLGVEAAIVDGVHIGNVFKKEATACSSTGVRGVYFVKKTGKYMASCQVHHEHWQEHGFPDIESAKKARDAAQAKLIEKYNVKNPKECNINE